ncbi:MAG: hypothetical protein N2V72_00555 [Methanophagales archaeon]|nr:hypothetical protein [Methanophagales archaeon]
MNEIEWRLHGNYGVYLKLKKRKGKFNWKSREEIERFVANGAILSPPVWDRGVQLAIDKIWEEIQKERG